MRRAATSPYNARCELSFLPPGERPAQGSALHALTIYRDAYFDQVI
jgi:hypothetical protein